MMQCGCANRSVNPAETPKTVDVYIQSYSSPTLYGSMIKRVYLTANNKTQGQNFVKEREAYMAGFGSAQKWCHRFSTI